MAMVSDTIINTVVIVVGICITVWIISQVMGVSLGEMLLGMRATARTQVDEEPRDQAERWTSNHRKMSRETRPKMCKFLAVAGDVDVPPRTIARITGIEPHQEGYLLYAKVRRIAWSRPFIIPRDLVSDLNRRTVVVEARGFTTNGIYRVPIPRTDSLLKPDDVQASADSLFSSSFGAQALVDAREDSVWAQATAFMPSIKDRLRVAEAQAPRFVERRVPGVGEDRAT